MELGGQMLRGGLDTPICYRLLAPTSGVHLAGLLIPARLWRT